MKNLIIFTILLLSSTIGSKAQEDEYHKFIEGPDKYWDVGQFEQGHLCNWSSKPPRRYFMQGDTIIDEKTYKKVFEYRMKSIYGDDQSYCPPFIIDTTFAQSDFFIREDTILKRVFRYDLILGGEKDNLLFDFSLEQGDTLKGANGEEYLVDTITTIGTFDGKKRKFIHLAPYPTVNGYLLEGIGGNRGPFIFPVPDFEGGHFPMCVKQNEQIIYGDYCYDFVTEVQNNALAYSSITIAPNPATDFIKLEIQDNRITREIEVEIIDLSGILVYRNCLSGSSSSINISNLKKGYYFIKIDDNNNNVTLKSFVKN